MSSHLTWQDSIVNTIPARAKNMPGWLVNLGVFQEMDDSGRAKPNGPSKSC